MPATSNEKLDLVINALQRAFKDFGVKKYLNDTDLKNKQLNLSSLVDNIEKTAIELESKQLEGEGLAKLQNEHDQAVVDVYKRVTDEFGLPEFDSTSKNQELFLDNMVSNDPESSIQETGFSNPYHQNFFDNLSYSLRLSKCMRQTSTGGSYYEVKGERMLAAATRRYLIDNSVNSVSIYPGDMATKSSLTQGLLGIAKVFSESGDNRSPIELKLSEGKLNDDPAPTLKSITECNNGFEALWKAVYLSVDSNTIESLKGLNNSSNDRLDADDVKRFLEANNINDPEGELSYLLSETGYNNIGTEVENTDLKPLLEQGRSNEKFFDAVMHQNETYAPVSTSSSGRVSDEFNDAYDMNGMQANMAYSGGGIYSDNFSSGNSILTAGGDVDLYAANLDGGIVANGDAVYEDMSDVVPVKLRSIGDADNSGVFHYEEDSLLVRELSGDSDEARDKAVQAESVLARTHRNAEEDVEKLAEKFGAAAPVPSVQMPENEYMQMTPPKNN